MPKNVVTNSEEYFSKIQAQSFAEVLKALGHPVRLQIIDILSKSSRSVTELAEMTEQQQAIVSQQLKILRLSGLVASERSEGRAYYSLVVENLRNLLACLRSCKAHMD